MKAVILCGGKGTRLESITKGAPKSLIELQGRTVMEHLFVLMKRHGISDITLAVGYGADMIREKFGDGSRHGIKITYIVENEPLGTAGPLKAAKGSLDSTFIVSNGDELKDIDIDAMLRFHRKNKALATIALTKVEDTTQYGIVDIRDGRITRFVEKPKRDEAPSNLANAGLYIMEPEVIGMIPDGFCMLERSVFPRTAESGRLFGFAFNGQWFDTGTPERYLRAASEWKGIRTHSASQKH